MPRLRASHAAVAIGLLFVIAACTPPPSTELAVRNDSKELFFVRLEGADGIAPRIYRVDPGAHGLAVTPQEKPASRIVVFNADCKSIAKEDNPQLGSMDVDRSGGVSLSVGLTRSESWWDVLPTAKACR